MRRRDLIKVISGAAIAWPFAARAQQPKRVRRLGVLLGLAESDHDAQSWINAFRLRLEELGWQDGRNIQIDYRWAENDNNKIASYTSELVGLAPDALFVGSQPVFDSVRQATRTVPIVFVQVSDPVAQGVIKSLAEPGGNFTGFSNVDFSVAGKWLELLREIAPAITQTNVILNPENGTN